MSRPFSPEDVEVIYGLKNTQGRDPDSRVLEILTAAEREAKALRDQAKQEGFEEGRKAGYAAGYAMGTQEARAEVARMTSDALERAAQEADELKRELCAQAALVAAEAAAVLYGEKVQGDLEHVGKVVAGLFAKATPRRVLAVQVAPEDLSFALDYRPKWAASFPDAADVRILPDASLERGACRVVTDGAGVLERDWPSRLSELSATLEAIWEADDGPSA